MSSDTSDLIHIFFSMMYVFVLQYFAVGHKHLRIWSVANYFSSGEERSEPVKIAHGYDFWD